MPGVEQKMPNAAPGVEKEDLKGKIAAKDAKLQESL